MIRKTYVCDICDRRVDPDKCDGYRLEYKHDYSFVFVGLTQISGSEKIICKACCQCIYDQHRVYKEKQ